MTTAATRWQAPAEVLALGATQDARYDGAPAWSETGNHGCTGGYTPGALELQAYIRAHFPVSSVGGYNCRRNTGATSQVSIHGVGRALDAMYRTVDGQRNPRGDELANWLVSNAKRIGIQHVIWNRSVWSVSGGRPRFGAYGGPNAHVDHVHLELTRAAGARNTPWFTDGGRAMPPNWGAGGGGGGGSAPVDPPSAVAGASPEWLLPAGALAAFLGGLWLWAKGRR